MKKALYPGSFDPFHMGHVEILKQALQIFDEVHIGVGVSPDKKTASYNDRVARIGTLLENNFNREQRRRIKVDMFTSLLVDNLCEKNFTAVIRGLRDEKDLAYEKQQQYWYEDNGLLIPVVYFIADRYTAHISSSMVRIKEKLKNDRV